MLNASMAPDNTEPDVLLRASDGRFVGLPAAACAPIAPPHFVSIEEATEEIRRHLKHFQCAVGVHSGEAPAPFYAIAASPGAGKSRLAREFIAAGPLQDWRETSRGMFRRLRWLMKRQRIFEPRAFLHGSGGGAAHHGRMRQNSACVPVQTWLQPLRPRACQSTRPSVFKRISVPGGSKNVRIMIDARTSCSCMTCRKPADDRG